MTTRAAVLGALAAGAAAVTGCLSKPGLECTLVPGPAREIEARIGTTGGVPAAKPIDCGERSVIGVGLTLTRNVEGAFGEKAIVSARLLCATLSQEGGDYMPTATEDTAPLAGSETNADGPFFGECSRGKVAIGLSAHIVGNGGLFNSVVLHCASLDAAGAPSGGVERVPVGETGEMPADADALCGEGEVLHGLDAMQGRLLDQLLLSCAATTCTRPPAP